MADNTPQTGVMVAFFLPPEIARQLNFSTNVENEPQDGLHVTLAFLGDLSDPQLADKRDLIAATLSAFTMNHAAVEGSINGTGRFQDNDPGALYVNFDSPDLPTFRQELVDSLAAVGVTVDGTHGFTPHITLAYLPKDQPTPDIALNPIPVEFETVSLAWGDTRTDFDLFDPDDVEGDDYAAADADDPVVPGAVMPEDDPNALAVNAIEDQAIQVIQAVVDTLYDVLLPDGMKSLPDGFRAKAVAQIERQIEKPEHREVAIAQLDRKIAAKSQPAEAHYTDPVRSVAVKSVEGDPYGFQGYAVIWGNAQQKDLVGEWFNKSLSDLGLEMNGDPQPPDVRIPALYEHGLNDFTGISQAGIVRYAKADDVGLFVQGELNRHNKYVDGIRHLMNRGILKFSSGALPQKVKSRADGMLERWPITEVSFTVQPIEPRGTDVTLTHLVEGNRVRAVKAAYKSLKVLPETLEALFDALQDTEPTEGAKDGNLKQGNADATKSMSGVTVVPPKSENSKPEGNFEMELTQENVTQIANAVTPMLTDAIKSMMGGQQAPAPQTPPPAPQVPQRPPLPTPQGGGNTASRISVGDDVRYAGMTSSDLSFMAQFMGDIASKDITGKTQIGRLASRFINDMQSDGDRKFERRIAAKAHREIARNEYSDTNGDLIRENLPYKSLSDVEANNWREVAIKSNELDTATQSHFVSDWVNQLWSDQIVLRARISNPIMNLLTRVNMPTNPFYLPIESSDPTVYYMVEGSDVGMLVLGSGNTVAMSKVRSDKLTLTAQKIGARIGYSTEVTEDALPFVIPQFNRQMTRVMHNGIDDTLINGDTATGATTNINYIDGTPSNTAGQLPNYLAFDGLRKYGLVTNTNQAYRVQGPPTLTAFRAARATLAAQYALDLPNLAYVVDVRTYFKMLSMPEFLTAQNIGGTALPTALTGMLPMGNPDQLSDTAQPVGMIDGIYVYVSAQINLTQTGAAGSGGGKYNVGTTANDTQGTALLIDRSRWFFGMKRGIEVDSFNIPYFSDTNQMLATARIALTPFDTTCAVVLYDINV